MTELHRVQIIAQPVECKCGTLETWREAAVWAAGQLHNRFGDAVQTEYYDLSEPGCPAIPANAELPVILVDGEPIDNGGKVSIPAIRIRLEALGAQVV
jgi:hypothetical protein